MAKYLLALAVLLIAWMSGKDALFDAIYKPEAGAALPAAPDYATDDGWITRPAEPPPGGWEKEWGTDIFLVLPAPREFGRAASVDPAAAMDALRAYAKAGFVPTFEGVAAVYAPAYRMPAPALNRLKPGDARIAPVLEAADQDLANAFETYLADMNRGRVIVIVSFAEAEHRLGALATRIEGDERLSERVAGYILLKAPRIDPESDPAVAEEIGPCTPALNGRCTDIIRYEPELPLIRFLLPQPPVRALPPAHAPFVTDADAKEVMDRPAQTVSWLEKFGTKPAPPLPPLEMIEVAPVQSPTTEPPEQR